MSRGLSKVFDTRIQAVLVGIFVTIWTFYGHTLFNMTSHLNTIISTLNFPHSKRMKRIEITKLVENLCKGCHKKRLKGFCFRWSILRAVTFLYSSINFVWKGVRGKIVNVKDFALLAMNCNTNIGGHKSQMKRRINEYNRKLYYKQHLLLIYWTNFYSFAVFLIFFLLVKLNSVLDILPLFFFRFSWLDINNNFPRFRRKIRFYRCAFFSFRLMIIFRGVEWLFWF